MNLKIQMIIHCLIFIGALKNSWEWIQYDFEKAEKVSYIKVYWFDDRPFGGCRIPDFWELQYKSHDKWLPVNASTGYTVTKDG